MHTLLLVGREITVMALYSRTSEGHFRWGSGDRRRFIGASQSAAGIWGTVDGKFVRQFYPDADADADGKRAVSLRVEAIS